MASSLTLNRFYDIMPFCLRGNRSGVRAMWRGFILTLLIASTLWIGCGERGEMEAREGAVFGLVRDALSGEPVAEAEVRLGDKSCMTGPDGMFRFEHVPYSPGLKLEVSAPGYETYVDEIPLDRPELELTIELTRKKGIVFGWVKDGVSKAPVPGVEVKLDGESHTTDQDGNFFFLDVPYSPDLRIEIDAPHYKPYSERVSLDKPELELSIYLERDFDEQREVEGMIAELERLISSDDPNVIPQLKGFFSRDYRASDDENTTFVVSLGLIPKNYEDIFPCLSSVFKKYDDVRFKFSEIKAEATTAYLARAKMLLTIHVRKVDKEEEVEVDLKCTLSLKRREGDWKISGWKLDEIIEIRQ